MSFHLSVLFVRTQHSTSWKSSKLLHGIWKASVCCVHVILLLLLWLLFFCFVISAQFSCVLWVAFSAKSTHLYNITFVIGNGIWEFRLNTLICCWVLLLASLPLLLFCLAKEICHAFHNMQAIYHLVYSAYYCIVAVAHNSRTYLYTAQTHTHIRWQSK